MKISILQWNIWGVEDIHNICKFLKENPADIFCLQELTVNYPKQTVKNTPNYLSKELGLNHFYKEVPIESIDGEKMWLANGVFCKPPMIKKDFCWTRQPGRAGDDNETRVYIEAELNINGHQLAIGTTHMSYTHRFEPTPNKIKETNRLLKFISKYSKKFIIAGDFNSAPGSYTIEKFKNKYQNLGPDFKQNTWATKPFSYNGFEESELNWRLDHIFGTKDIKLIKSEILQTEFSDHLPILSIIEI
jgi:endonuclease/exonuclease/phosphatase family metal-dependent hydrolase